MKQITFQWKKDFLETQWYKDNPAGSYLSDHSKVQLLIEYITGNFDLDSEVEVVVNDVPS